MANELLISSQVEQAVRVSPNLIVVDISRGTQGLIFDPPNFKDLSAITNRVHIFCSPLVPTYDPELLESLLVDSTENDPDHIIHFGFAERSLRNSMEQNDLILGKKFFTQKLGKTRRSVRYSTQELDLVLINRAGIDLESYGGDEELLVREITTLHIYPDQTSAKWMHEYSKSPYDWDKRKDWFDPDSGFFWSFVNTISAFQLEEIKLGRNIFDAENPYD